MPSENGLHQTETAGSSGVANGADGRSSPDLRVGPSGPSSKAIEDVLYSDIGVKTLLNRLKQSIASARDFAAFLKKRSSLEEDHAQGLKKLCKSTHETLRRPESRSDSYSLQFDRVIGFHERIADNGMQFALSLHQMHEDLMELSTNMDRGRKQWKTTGLAAEKKVQDAESLMEKAKAKYDSLAEEYDRARTGDKGSTRGFLKKSGPQHEEELLKKVQGADSDYAAKVQAAQTQRQELLATHRPQNIKALQELIAECDSALALQLQKFASFNEKLTLGNGIIISPVKAQDGSSAVRSLRDTISAINNEQDLSAYILSQSSKVPARAASIQYRRHPTLTSTQQTPPGANRFSAQSNLSQSQPPPLYSVQPPQQPTLQIPSDTPQSHTSSSQPSYSPSPQRGLDTSMGSAPSRQQNPYVSPDSPQHATPLPPQLHIMNPSTPQSASPSSPQTFFSDLPPLKPVFGQDLEYLFRRDGSAVPTIVYQCIQAVDLFGLDVEGIYRLSGNAQRVNELKAIFDHDPSPLDFHNPAHFHHDIHVPASLLKLFLRSLPTPLFTHTHHAELLAAARIADDTVRRDSLHAIINNLPDPHYATLRALVLHLWRVREHEGRNRMGGANLAICWAPALMGGGGVGGGGSGGGGSAGGREARGEAALQVRVVETIVENTYRIFDED